MPWQHSLLRKLTASWGCCLYSSSTAASQITQKPGSLDITLNYLTLSSMGRNPAQLCSPKAVVKASPGQGLIQRLDRGSICFQAHAVVGRIQFPKKCGKRATVLCWPLARGYPQSLATGPPCHQKLLAPSEPAASGSGLL